MGARVGCCVSLFLGLGLGSAACRGEDTIDPVWRAKAQTEGQAAYEKYLALVPRLEEVSECCAVRLDGGTGAGGGFSPHTRRERAVRLGDCMLVDRVRIYDAEPSKPKIRLECENPDYHFTLGKQREDAPWALTDYGRGAGKNPLINQGFGQPSSVFSDLRDAISATAKDSKYTLRALRFDAAKGLLRIDFAFPRQTPAEKQVTLDPSHDWRVVESRFETPNLIGTDQVIYGISVGGVTFPTEVKGTSKYKVAKAPPDFITTNRLISIKLTDKTPDDFRLPAFGFPEPEDVPTPPKPTRWYIWIIAVAGVCAVLAFGFGYLHRRFRRSAIALQEGGP